jgi:hypothetical protein
MIQCWSNQVVGLQPAENAQHLQTTILLAICCYSLRLFNRSSTANLFPSVQIGVTPPRSNLCRHCVCVWYKCFILFWYTLDILFLKKENISCWSSQVGTNLYRCSPEPSSVALFNVLFALYLFDVSTIGYIDATFTSRACCWQSRLDYTTTLLFLSFYLRLFSYCVCIMHQMIRVCKREDPRSFPFHLASIKNQRVARVKPS